MEAARPLCNHLCRNFSSELMMGNAPTGTSTCNALVMKLAKFFKHLHFKERVDIQTLSPQHRALFWAVRGRT